jgi:hypothetical protein
MQKTHPLDAERAFVMARYRPHYACRKERKRNDGAVVNTYRKRMAKGGIMRARKDRGRRVARPTAGALARPRELFGESLPELLLVTAVVAAVVSGVLALG